MSQVSALMCCDVPDEAGSSDIYARVAGKNINERTLLATDYLNHFNEIIMLIELVPDMPEMMEEVRAWEPKSYERHFQDSGFAAKELAIEAYQASPVSYRVPFDRAVQHMDELVAEGLESLGQAVEADDPDRTAAIAARVTDRLRRFVDVASGIIHGDERTMDQHDIDGIMSAR